MHEASLIAGLIRQIETLAQKERARRVVGVSVRLGALSHMSVDHFREHFEQAATGTVAEGARLAIFASKDEQHANAGDVLLESLEVECE